jgi:alpha-N-arabinofuranosidase
VSASATRAADASATHLSLVNTHPSQSVVVSVTLAGMTAKTVGGRVITAQAMDAHNTFAAPDAVKPEPFTGATLKGDVLEVVLPAKAVVILTLQ